jgi:hypothetical protein
MGILWMVLAVLECVCWIIDVELGIYWSPPYSWKKRACFVGQLTMELEDPGSTTIVNSVVHLTAYRGHGECIVVIADMHPKLLASVILAIIELGQFMGKSVQRGKLDLSTDTAYAKFGMDP